MPDRPATSSHVPAGNEARPVASPLEPRQRWRVVFRRRPDAPPLQQRELLAAWQDGLAGSGLPLLPSDRPKLSFAVALPVGMAAERELLDLVLSERRRIDEVRRAIVGALPSGHDLIDLHDAWLGEPALPGQVVAADYRIALEGELDAFAVAAAAERLVASPTLLRPRPKGGGDYDLRPLFDAIAVDETADGLVLRVRTRFDPEQGAGRPEEVVAALADVLGSRLTAGTIVRERVLLGSDL